MRPPFTHVIEFLHSRISPLRWLFLYGVLGWRFGIALLPLTQSIPTKFCPCILTKKEIKDIRAGLT